MKKLLFIALFAGLGLTGFAQKYAIIDTRYILDKMPEYKEAQKAIRKKNCGIFNANALVLRGICSKKDRNW